MKREPFTYDDIFSIVGKFGKMWSVYKLVRFLNALQSGYFYLEKMRKYYDKRL